MNAIGKRWMDFWFGSSPVLNLAVFRIVVVGVQLILLVDRWPLYAAAATLPDTLYDPLLALRIVTLDLVSVYRPDEFALRAFYGIALISGALSLFGWRTNASLFAFLYSVFFLTAHHYSFGEIHHPQAVFMIALACLVISPSGAALSLDSVRQERRHGPSPKLGPDGVSTFAKWPLNLMLVLFALFYLSAIYTKITKGEGDWANGFTLQYYFIRDGLRWDGRLGGDVALWLSQYHYLVLAMQWAVVAFQSTFWLALFFRRLLWLFIPLGVIFHAANWFLLSAPFPEWIACYAAFVPWWAVRQRVMSSLELSPNVASPAIGAMEQRHEAWLIYDGDCPFCSAYVKLTRLRENLGTLHLVNARETDHPVVRDARSRFDLDKGMVLRIGHLYYHGDACVHVLALLSQRKGVVGAVIATVFASPILSRLLYPALRAGRDLVLRALGRTRLSDVVTS